MLKGYIRLPNGVIKQDGIIKEKMIYDIQYIRDRYDSYGDLCVKMAWLRIGYIFSVITGARTLLDIGYGNGAFLEEAKSFIKCYGYDVSGYDIPEGCELVHPNKAQVDIITLFDVLEHYEDIYEIKNYDCNYFVISVPNVDKDGFDAWKHRRPDEHLYHFDIDSLSSFMSELNYNCISYSYIEDLIRKPDNDKPNILTAIFQRNR